MGPMINLIPHIARARTTLTLGQHLYKLKIYIYLQQCFGIW